MTNSAIARVRVAVLLTTVAVVVVLLLANAVGAFSGGDPSTGTSHAVAAGETLWDIATSHTAAGNDVRRTVFDIQKANGLDGSLIIPGQLLLIPNSG
jgi:nucleoid-associated protein YgaU